uniref:Peptidase A1 domain-containing protein n=1 Tax=Fagus sylvatica TaxID=28930 RepID=A0A2N9E177_FAGSY
MHITSPAARTRYPVRTLFVNPCTHPVNTDVKHQSNVTMSFTVDIIKLLVSFLIPLMEYLALARESPAFYRSLVVRICEHYSPGYAELKYGEKSTGIENLLTVFDSGSTYTYLISSAYQAFISLVMEELTGSSLSEALDDHTLTLCWKGEKPFKSLQDVKTYFKPFALSFTNGGKAEAKFEMPLEAYLIISHKGNVCLGILDGGKIDVNIIGDISMQDKLVIYNNEEQLIGWMNEKNCDLLPEV